MWLDNTKNSKLEFKLSQIIVIYRFSRHDSYRRQGPFVTYKMNVGKGARLKVAFGFEGHLLKKGISFKVGISNFDMMKIK